MVPVNNNCGRQGGDYIHQVGPTVGMSEVQYGDRHDGSVESCELKKEVVCGVQKWCFDEKAG